MAPQVVAVILAELGEGEGAVGCWLGVFLLFGRWSFWTERTL